MNQHEQALDKLAAEWRVELAIADEEIARLKNQLATGVHTCHAECERVNCVAMRQAVMAEREACAVLLEKKASVCNEGIAKSVLFFNARAIRARQEVKGLDLLAAAEAVVARWDSQDWKDAKHTGEYIAELRAAIYKAQGKE